MQQTVFTSEGEDSFQVEAHSANSTHMLTLDGDACIAAAVFENGQSPTHTTPLHIPQPVRIVKENGVEEMRYNSSAMKTGKIYQVRWNGKMYGLRKTESEVEILRFYPDDNEHGD